VPWERRGELGPASAFFETVFQSLLRPAAFFRSMDPAGSLGAALFYAIVVGWGSFLSGALWELLLPFHWPTAFGSLAERSTSGAEIALGLALGLVAIPLFVPVGVFVVSLVYHGLLLLFGGARWGLEATVRTVAYASGAQLLNVVPICGVLLILVWGVVVQVIGLREVHGIQTGKALAVVLIPYLLCAILVVGLIVLVLVALPGALDEVLRQASP
jgi:hypothetical protein